MTVVQTEIRYTILGRVAPLKVQKEWWQMDEQAVWRRVQSKVQRPKFATVIAANEYIAALQAGRDPVTSRTSHKGETDEQRRARRREANHERHERRKRMQEQLEAMLQRQQEVRDDA